MLAPENGAEMLYKTYAFEDQIDRGILLEYRSRTGTGLPKTTCKIMPSPIGIERRRVGRGGGGGESPWCSCKFVLPRGFSERQSTERWAANAK